MKYFFSLLLILSFIACSKSTPLPYDNTVYYQYIPKESLSLLDFKGEEIISTVINNEYYYVRKDGKAIKTLTYDNAADPFSDGLARTKINGKIGFFNTNLDIILKPIYDFAFPFYKGIAEICTGCKEKQEGEHSMLDGGKWQKINREGLVIE